MATFGNHIYASEKQEGARADCQDADIADLDFLKREPVKIGDIEIGGNVYIPPMAGYTDYVYRKLCQEYDPGVLMATEMLSSVGLKYQKDECQKMFIGEDEKLTGIQLFGHEPDAMEIATKKAEDAGALFIDINMGCPVPKITKTMDGAGMMREPELALEVVKTVMKATKLPVTVKTRLGWCYDSLNACDLAKSFEDAGVKAMTIHGRTRSQKYTGHARWDLIKNVVEAVSIPIFANGDIRNIDDVARILKITNAAGVAIARGTMGRPWFSAQVNHFIKTGERIPEPSPEERFDLAIRHAQMMIEYKGPVIGAREARKHVVNYTAGVPGAAKLRGKLALIDSVESVAEVINEMKDTYKLHKDRFDAKLAEEDIEIDYSLEEGCS